MSSCAASSDAILRAPSVEVRSSSSFFSSSPKSPNSSSNALIAQRSERSRD